MPITSGYADENFGFMVRKSLDDALRETGRDSDPDPLGHQMGRKTMSTDLSRRGLIKAGMIGAVAAGAAAVSVPARAGEKGKTEDYDVVVIGCGCAGMSAAIEAKNAGAKVCILDKMSRPSGNTIFSGGIINAAGT